MTVAKRTRREPLPEHLRWLKARGYSLAPLTGTDLRALAAIAGCWELFCSTKDESILRAIGILARFMQHSTLFFARELAAWQMDWDDRDRYWPTIEFYRAPGKEISSDKDNIL